MNAWQAFLRFLGLAAGAADDDGADARKLEKLRRESRTAGEIAAENERAARELRRVRGTDDRP